MSLLGPEGRKQLKIASRFGAIGMEMVLATCVGYFGGRWLDGQLHTTPVLQYVGLAVGLMAAFKGLWTLAKRTNLDSL